MFEKWFVDTSSIQNIEEAGETIGFVIAVKTPHYPVTYLPSHFSLSGFTRPENAMATLFGPCGAGVAYRDPGGTATSRPATRVSATSTTRDRVARPTRSRWSLGARRCCGI